MKRLVVFVEKCRKMTLANKMIIAISLSTIILIMIISIFNYSRTTSIITEQQSISSSEILALKTHNFESYFDQIKDYSLTLRNDAKFMQLIRTHNIDNYDDILYIQGLLRNMFYSRKDISELKLYMVNYGSNFSISRHVPNIKLELNNIDSHPSIQKASQAKYYIYVEPADDTSLDSIKIWRTIINIADQKALGYVEMTMDSSFLEKLANNSSSDQNVFHLIDSSGNLYYTNSLRTVSEDTLVDLIQAASLSPDGNFIHHIDKVPYLVVFEQTSNADFILFNLIPKSLIDSAAVNARNTSMVIAFSALALSICLILLLIKTLLKPLNLLAEQMKVVGNGDFRVQLKRGGSAEIDNLSKQFNSMITRIDELIEKNYISELNEKMSRLQALEAQINPHFINNTLQAISAQAILNRQRGISKMIEALAFMLRYSITEGDIMPVHAEIKHVRDYLMLQKARFSERLDYRINVDESLNDFLIPKIFILTMVENAIIHCLETSSECIMIEVSIFTCDGYLTIKVEDNGCGMSPERLDEIRTQLKNSDRKAGCIGLKNIASRLSLLYENMASMEIESVQGKGTIIVANIPLNKEVPENV